MTHGARKTIRGLALAGAAFAFAPQAAPAAEIELNVLGITSTSSTQVEAEVPFYENLASTTGLDIEATYRHADVAGINQEDTLRMVSSGVFDIVQSSIGPAARDDLFLEGFDLVGVSPTMDDLKAAVESYREVFSTRVEERFGVRPMALWPYGPQVFYCGESVASMDDLQGKKVRSYTASMSALVTALGAIPVTMDYPEVYLALQRGVIDCAITSPTSGNTGKWPEVTDNLIPLGINWAMNAHFMNSASYNELSPEAQTALDEAFVALEEDLWERSARLSDEAIACNVGADSCSKYTKFEMNLIEVSDADRARLAEAVTNEILPAWGKTCNSVYSECTAVWNKTVGAARGITISE